MGALFTNVNELTVKEQTFCDNYLIHGSATKAAISAGYSEKSARVTGPRMLRNPAVAEYLNRQQIKRQRKEDSLQDKILDELKAMAFGSIEHFITIDSAGQPQVDFSRATPEQLRAITSAKSKSRKIYNAKGDHIATEDSSAFTMADKYRGLELLGRQIGMFKVEEQKIVVDVADRLLNARARLLNATEQRSSDDDEVTE